MLRREPFLKGLQGCIGILATRAMNRGLGAGLGCRACKEVVTTISERGSRFKVARAFLDVPEGDVVDINRRGIWGPDYGGFGGLGSVLQYFGLGPGPGIQS